MTVRLGVARLLLPGGVWGGPATVTVAGGRIESIAPGLSDGAVVVDGTLTPGLIDVHNNGAFGVDFATGDAAAWRRVRAGLARRGVTTVVPTVITAPIPVLLAVFRRVVPWLEDAAGRDDPMRLGRVPGTDDAGSLGRVPGVGGGAPVARVAGPGDGAPVARVPESDDATTLARAPGPRDGTPVAPGAGPDDGAPLARVPGLHLEGPFLAPERRGAHRLDWVVDPTAERVAALLDDPAVRRGLRIVTLAPERPGALAAIRRLSQAGIVVCMGHSDATAAQARAGREAGATGVTHVFNAMRPFTHRDPGLVAEALTDPALRPCLIVDGLHVDAAAARLAFAAAGARLVAVSDAIAVAGLPPGSAVPFGGEDAVLGADGLGRRADGTIAGAGLLLDEGVRRMIGAGIAPEVVLRAATEAPAALLGGAGAGVGRLVPGGLADLVLWDATWMPRRVWIGGVEVGGG